jgi:hypothetical protein
MITSFKSASTHRKNKLQLFRQSLNKLDVFNGNFGHLLLKRDDSLINVEYIVEIPPINRRTSRI